MIKNLRVIASREPMVLADVSFLGEYLDLNMDWTDLHPTGKRSNDVLLLTNAAKKKIDRLHLENLDITTIVEVNDSILDVPYRN